MDFFLVFLLFAYWHFTVGLFYDFIDVLTSIQDINQKTQSPQKFMPGKLKRSGFLSGCFHFHKSDPAAGHQYDAIWNACRSGRREFPAHTAVLFNRFCQFFFNDFFSNGFSLFFEKMEVIGSQIQTLYIEKIFTFFLACVKSVYEFLWLPLSLYFGVFWP